MKCSISIVLILALVATALADAPGHSPGARKAGLAKKSHEARAAHPQKAHADSRKAAPKEQSLDSAQIDDFKGAVKSAISTLTPLARQGSSLALDAARSALGSKQGRSSENLQRRAAKLAGDSLDAVRVLAPVLSRAARDAYPYLADSARSIIASLTQ